MADMSSDILDHIEHQASVIDERRDTIKYSLSNTVNYLTEVRDLIENDQSSASKSITNLLELIEQISSSLNSVIVNIQDEMNTYADNTRNNQELVLDNVQTASTSMDDAKAELDSIQF